MRAKLVEKMILKVAHLMIETLASARRAKK
jgi:hypothetical protein